MTVFSYRQMWHESNRRCCIVHARHKHDLITGDTTLLTAQTTISHSTDWGLTLERAIAPVANYNDMALINSSGIA